MLSWNLAYSRLQRPILHTISVAIVVVLALLSLLAIQGISRSTVDSAVTYSLSKLPGGDRTLTMSSNRIFTSPTEYQSNTDYWFTFSGRFPTHCIPIRCEVLQIGGDSKSVPRPDSFKLVIGGVGQSSDNRLFAGRERCRPRCPNT